MKTNVFYSKITSAQLKENLTKQFGANVNLDQYDREQLEDIRNKLRTRVFQQEGSSGVNDLLTNETYQKDKAMLELLNTRIKEMLGEDIKKLRDKMDELSEAKKGTRPPKTKITAKGSKPDFLDMDKDGDKKEPMKKAIKDKAVKEGAKPDFLDMDKDGNKKEPMKKAIKDKKVKESICSSCNEAPCQCDSVKEGWDEMQADVKSKSKEKGTGKFDKKDTGTGTQYTRKSSQLEKGAEDPRRPASTMKSKKTGKALAQESMFKHNVKFVNESINFLLQEDEEGKAKAITAAGDMVNDYTSWMQRVGQYQTKTMIELADAIKADFGAAEAEAFKAAVGPALSATLEVLTQQREAVSNAVAVLAGEATPEVPMGAEPGMDAGMDAGTGMDATEPDVMNNPIGGDEFGASDAAAGAGSTGREMRESKFARKLAESHSIMAKLAK